MYRHCIYCSGDLGRNESIESFPVGTSIAFDAAKGRLWAVCPRCARWNLSLLEERWGAVEEAEKRFVDSRLRAQSENVGLAKLPDGTRLIRIGKALPGELAAWRYGTRLVRRRWRYLAAAGGSMALAMGAVGAGALVPAATVAGVAGMLHLFVLRPLGWPGRWKAVYVHRPGGPRGGRIMLRREDFEGAHLATPEGGGAIELHVPMMERDRPRRGRIARQTLVLGGHAARTALGRALVYANETGATQAEVERAVRRLSASRSPEHYLGEMAEGWMRLSDGPAPIRLALEMALHEETERRALHGELALLEAAWRQAEEIAAIADRLAISGTALPGETGPATSVDEMRTGER